MGQINVINCVSVTKILIRTIATWAISKIFGCDRAIVLLFWTRFEVILLLFRFEKVEKEQRKRAEKEAQAQRKGDLEVKEVR